MDHERLLKSLTLFLHTFSWKTDFEGHLQGPCNLAQPNMVLSQLTLTREGYSLRDLKDHQSISGCSPSAWIRHSARSSTLTLHNGHRDR
jgi:hypothetical protein